MITAGRDTVGHVTSRILQALATHPNVQQRLRDEILHVTAAAGSCEPDFTTLNEMPYLDAVIRETMRLYVPCSINLLSSSCCTAGRLLVLR